MKTRTLTAILHKEDLYVAQCPEVGTVDYFGSIEFKKDIIQYLVCFA